MVFLTAPAFAQEMPQPRSDIAALRKEAKADVAIRKTLTGDVYVALGDQVREQPGAWRICIAHHPLIDWVFGGAALIALGGFLSLAARVRRRAPAVTPATEAAPVAEPVGPASVTA